MDYRGSMPVFSCFLCRKQNDFAAEIPRSVLTAIRGLQAAGSETCGEAVGSAGNC